MHFILGDAWQIIDSTLGLEKQRKKSHEWGRNVEDEGSLITLHWHMFHCFSLWGMLVCASPSYSSVTLGKASYSLGSHKWIST